MSAESVTKQAKADVESLREQLHKKRAVLRDGDGGLCFLFFFRTYFSSFAEIASSVAQHSPKQSPKHILTFVVESILGR